MVRLVWTMSVRIIPGSVARNCSPLICSRYERALIQDIDNATILFRCLVAPGSLQLPLITNKLWASLIFGERRDEYGSSPRICRCAREHRGARAGAALGRSRPAGEAADGQRSGRDRIPQSCPVSCHAYASHRGGVLFRGTHGGRTI